MTGASMRTLTAADGTTLAYRAFAAAHGFADGVPIVLLHATLSASVQLAGIARLLVARGPVLALDRRGSGDSVVATPRPLDVAVHVADVVALLDAEDVDAAILVGHSFGGVVALEAAARLPGRVRAVVAWEPPYGPLADQATRVAFAAVGTATQRAYADGQGAAAAAAFLDGVAGAGAWAALSARARTFLSAQGAGAFADASLSGLDPAGLARIAAPVTILTGDGQRGVLRADRPRVGRIDPRGASRGHRRAPPSRPDHRPRARGGRCARVDRAGGSAGRPGGRPVTKRHAGLPSGRATERGNAAPSSEVSSMFDGISRVYDPMNLVISAFQEPRWRRRAVALAGLGPGGRAIDVATGTGKVAADLHRVTQPGGEVLGVDISPGMISVAGAGSMVGPG